MPGALCALLGKFGNEMQEDTGHIFGKKQKLLLCILGLM